MKFAQHVFTIVVCLTAFSAEGADRPFRVSCKGLESFDIRGTFNVDWGWGTIRSNDGTTIGFAVGHPVEDAVPAERPAGFRSFHRYKIGKVVIRHGYYVRRKEYRATIVGAPLARQMLGGLQLVGSAKDAAVVQSLARDFAIAQCTIKFVSPPN